MGRIYSKHGCSTCKRRKKKCDETKPICAMCTRAGFECGYTAKAIALGATTTTSDVSVLRLADTSPLYQVQALPTVEFFNSTDEAVLYRAPPAVLHFFNPTSGNSCRNQQSLWYLSFKDELVRSAYVACFSAVLPGKTIDCGRLNHVTYGRALQLLLSKWSKQDMDCASYLSMQTAIIFLGLLDSIGPPMPDMSKNLLRHWTGLIAVLGWSSSAQLEAWSGLPRNLYLLILEAALYHMAVQTIFAHDLKPVEQTWRSAGIYEKLNTFNPEGDNRVTDSPLIGGQYLLFETARKITFLLRTPCHESVPIDVLNGLQNSIDRKSSTMGAEFEALVHLSISKRQFMLDTCQLYCRVLSICIALLRKNPSDQLENIRRLRSDAMQFFLDMPVMPTSHGQGAYAMLLLGCSIESEEDMGKFMEKYEQCKVFLDAGHLARTNIVLDRAAALREQQSNGTLDQEDIISTIGVLPVGLWLLRRPNGILS